jgi:hypothetical protein
VLLAAGTGGPELVASAQSPLLSVVLVRPVHIHPGDPVWVSGAGFPAGQQVKEVYDACPDVFSGAPASVNGVGGPLADAHGQFKGFAFHPTSDQTVSGPELCTIYATVGNNPFPDIAGRFYFLPPNQRLDRCDRLMCGVKISPHPRQVHSGLREDIQIAGAWPGARADVTVTFPGIPPQKRSVVLDWKGSGLTRIPVNVHLGTGAVVKVRVRAQLHLGETAGNAFGNFSVVR